MKILILFLMLVPVAVWAEGPVVVQSSQVKAVTVSPGVILKELTGRTAAGSARSETCSVAFFHLEPGRASAWSYNKVAEESFFILKGRGTIWTGDRGQAVEAGSFILVPPKVVRSVRANRGEVLEFYAVTSPAWSPEDDFRAPAPVGFSK
jgi:mannose-6-phosphate isomerase-like protein (cupin superfamily)